MRTYQMKIMTVSAAKFDGTLRSVADIFELLQEAKDLTSISFKFTAAGQEPDSVGFLDLKIETNDGKFVVVDLDKVVAVDSDGNVSFMSADYFAKYYERAPLGKRKRVSSDDEDESGF